MLLAIYGTTIFLSAFLLFQVQPVMARMILPWFGGSSAVWAVCLLFFQVTLLAGYAYAHWLHGRLQRHTQTAVHAALLAASLFVLPVIPAAEWRPSPGTFNPSFRILGMLAATVGMPYFLLSTTSPLVQAWYSRTEQQAAPYRLFALSNLAALAALALYPFAVEPYVPVHAQAVAWSWGYGVFAFLCAGTAWHSNRMAACKPTEQRTAAAEPGTASYVMWISLAGCSSILLLAVTSYLTQDVASIPFLWILPLSVYLLTFVLCFDSDRIYRRRLFFQLSSIAIAATGYLLLQGKSMPNVVFTVSFLAVSLFAWCMTCHGELARMKPEPGRLTSYYLAISAGGALGGVFAGLIAPLVFDSYYEFPAGLALTAILMAVVAWRDDLVHQRRFNFWPAILLAVTFTLLGSGVRASLRGCSVVTRNFYGQLRVCDEGGVRKLFHGVITHGHELLDARERRRPTAYYCEGTGVGLAWNLARQGGAGIRAGVVGLGAGALAAYGAAGDTLRFYELNPQVLEVARRDFHFLNDSPAKIEVVLGDARLALEAEAPQQFDLLAVDAFSGDAVPVHLLTSEAFTTYLRHIKPGGIIAFHITNLFLNLEPVVARAASALGKRALMVDFVPSPSDPYCFGTQWALIVDASDSRFPSARPAHPPSGFRLWTDDYSSIFPLLRR